MPRVVTKSLQLWCGLGLLLVGFAVRLPHLNQSLWYDELTTLAQYVIQPWRTVLAAGAGEYVPNNHVLHSILAKIVYGLGSGGQAVPPREALLRLPALLAGVLFPLALAWPLRRSDPLLALGVALAAELNPWLLAFSVEARGYSLLLLLGTIATNTLPIGSVRRPIVYAASLTLAIYTIPLAIFLFPAHGLAVLILNRRNFSRWLATASIGLFLAVILYLPMLRGLISYYRHPYLATMSYRQFLNALPRYALNGTDASPGAIYWALPVIAITIGSVIGWSRSALRPMLITFAGITLMGVVLPLLIHSATEVRFVPWILPWFVLSVAALFLSGDRRWGRGAGIVGLCLLIAWQTIADFYQPPNQQIREGMELADKIVPPGRDIMVLYLGAREAVVFYGTGDRFLAAPDTQSIRAAQSRALAETGHRPWVVIFYEKLAFERNDGPPEARGLWAGLVKHYHAVCRLPGRVSPVAIYAPDQDD
jgi:hypothetical protein